MKYVYIIMSVETFDPPRAISTATSISLASSTTAEGAHSRIELFKRDRELRGATIRRDEPHEWEHSGDAIRKVWIDRIEQGGYTETLTIRKYNRQKTALRLARLLQRNRG